MPAIQPILKMRVSVTNLAACLQQVMELAGKKKAAYICLSNVLMCMLTFDNDRFLKIVNDADLVIPDGKPISVAQRLLGHKRAQQVRGQDIMNAICASSGEYKLKIGFYGGSSDPLLNKMISKLKSVHTGIQIAYVYAPPFRPLTAAEDINVCDEINRANVDILFVGIGCPKQEIWMEQHMQKLNCVMLGVGAAFDFIAGNQKHAPKWMQEIGVEWLYRLCNEPKRLWKRYCRQNPRFIYHFIHQLIRN